MCFFLPPEYPKPPQCQRLHLIFSRIYSHRCDPLNVFPHFTGKIFRICNSSCQDNRLYVTGHSSRFFSLSFGQHSKPLRHRSILPPHSLRQSSFPLHGCHLHRMATGPTLAFHLLQHILSRNTGLPNIFYQRLHRKSASPFRSKGAILIVDNIRHFSAIL